MLRLPRGHKCWCQCVLLKLRDVGGVVKGGGLGLFLVAGLLLGLLSRNGQRAGKVLLRDDVSERGSLGRSGAALVRSWG